MNISNLLIDELANVSDPVLYNLCHNVLACPLFQLAPGSLKHHHAYDGGLAEHTYQVAHFAIRASSCFPVVKLNALVTAAIYHDYGKIWEYEKQEGVWVAALHKSQIGHVVSSYAKFKQDVAGLNHPLEDAISHCILAHHGRKEWGSPVEPQTVEALLLHQADMLSAGFGGLKI